MNRTCNGDFFQAEGELFYRCVGDGTVVAVYRNGHVGASSFEKEPCPACGRRISDAKRHGKVKTTTDITVGACFGGMWVDISNFVRK